MANPYEKYAKPKEGNPYAKYKDGGKDEPSGVQEAVTSIMDGLPGRFGARVGQGALSVPGFPIDAMVGGGNWLRRQFDKPEVPVEPGTPAHDWGSPGWLKFFEKYVGKANVPDPTTETERVTDKLGMFVGGGLPFGPAGLLPSVTAAGGSEVGRATDEAGITPKGYGEFFGALAGGVGPGLVRGHLSATDVSAPSVAALRIAKNAAYQAAEREGVIFTPQHLERLNEAVKKLAADRAHLKENEPGISGGLRLLEETAAKGENATLTHLDKVRKAFGNAGGDFTKPSQQALSIEIKKIIDDFTDPANLIQGDVLAGDIAAASKHLNSARSLNQRMRLAEVIDEALYQAERKAPTSGTGGNLENAMRQKIREILASKKRRASFSKEERALMEKITDGSWTQNRLRQIGGFAPSKGFLPAILAAHLGMNAAGVPIGSVTLPASLAFIGATEGSKALAEAITKRNIARLNATVRLRGTPKPTAKERVNAAWLEAQRRARLAGQSTAPVLPGATRQGN